MKINGIQSKCPNQNCNYIINRTITPILEKFTQNGIGLTIILSNYEYITFHKENVCIKYCNTSCNITSFFIPIINCSLPYLVLNSCELLIHIENIGYVLDSPDLNNMPMKCLEAQYNNLGNCSDCDFSCETCTDGNSSSCLTCKENKIYYQGYCLDSCPVRTYFKTSINECDVCVSNCEICQNQSDVCVLCTEPLFLLNYSCVLSCPDDYFIANKSCIECDPNLYETINGLQFFCDNITKISFSLSEINNPTIFKLEFSQNWSKLTYENLKESIWVTIDNLNKNNYSWKIDFDLESQSNYLFEIDYYNCSFLERDLKKLKIQLNETKMQTKQFLFANNESEIFLKSWKICSDQNLEYYNSSNN